MRTGLTGLGSVIALVGWTLVFATDHWRVGAAAIYVGSALLLAVVITSIAAFMARGLGRMWRSGEVAPPHVAVSVKRREKPRALAPDILSLSTDASIVAILALVAIAAIVLPPLDSDYHPGTAAEWVLYAIVVVPAGAALAMRSIKRVGNDYRGAWSLIGELFRLDLERNGSAPRSGNPPS